MLRGGSRTFYAASFLLPPRIRAPACALYAFCRVADDAVDQGEPRNQDGPAQSLHSRLDAIARLRERLSLAYAGTPKPIATDRALADVVARFAIPQVLPQALIEGFEWDAMDRRYATLGELQAYAARVAGSVGAMMAVLMGVRSWHGVARACDLGVAMQLSNIARDVGEDARSGRLYLPLDWLAEAGIEADGWLARPAFSDPLASVIGRVLQAADALYERSRSGIACLPTACRPGIGAARVLYREIGREVQRRGCDSVSSRAVVARRRKAWLLTRSLAFRARSQGEGPPPLEATRFLVEAVTSAPALSPPAPEWPSRGEAPRADLADRTAWVFALFERLRQQEPVGRSRL